MPRDPLSPAHVKALIERGNIVPPTKADLEDKSKSDALSKRFALVQTVWFVLQCIARRVQHLPIAELEVMTIAYTAISLTLYAF